MHLGFITGLTAEARLLRDQPVSSGVGGGSAEGAAHAAEALVGKVDGLVSFGLAGGLDSVLAPGAIIIPHRVVSAGSSYDCDPDLVTRLGGPTCDLLLGGTTIAATARQKSELFATTGASAIDLETGAVAAVAKRHGLPFAALRAVADPAIRALPEAALLALDAEGRIRLARIAASLGRSPAQIPQLAALARDAAAARRALKARLALIRAEIGKTERSGNAVP